MKNKLQDLRVELKKAFHEREDLVDAMLTAIVAREHVFVLGPPGTAKSMIAETLCSKLGGKMFSILNGKFTTPEEYFGPYDLKALEDGRYERRIANFAPSAHIIFDDEVWKASTAISNAKLKLYNERVFFNDGKRVDCPLITVVGASNELPQGEELGAIWDRFGLRLVVNRLQHDKSFEDMFLNGVDGANVPELSLADLESEQKAASKVDVAGVVDTIKKLRKAVDEEGIYVSDRKWVQIGRILRAYAHLNGRTAVTEEDLDILVHVLWNTPDQQRTIRRLVNKLANPVGEQIMKHVDAAVEVNEKIGKNEIPAVEAQKKVKESVRKLEEIVKANPTNTKAKEALAKVKAINLGILKEHLGLGD